MSNSDGTILLVLLVLVTASTLLSAGDVRAFDPDDAEQLQRAIDAYSHEPDVYDVQQQVLEHREIDDDRPDRWTRRARLANLLPRLQGQASWLDQRDRQDRFREDIEADDAGDYERNRAQHLWRDTYRLRGIYSLRADFDLAGLIYSGDEMTIQREVRQRWRMRDDLVEEVTELYYTRRRLQLHLELFEPDDPEVLLDRHLEIQALTARIDALTGGWFRRQLDEDPR